MAILQKAIIVFSFIISWTTVLNAQTYSIILGRPTDMSITASVMFDNTSQFYLEDGLQSGVYTHTTNTYTIAVNSPEEVDLTNLTSDTKYYYRMQHRLVGSGSYTPTPEYSFHTQRSLNSTFTFTIGTKW